MDLGPRAALYQALDIPNSVRLLQLRRDRDSSVTGLLQTVVLDAPDCPPFTALSYVWGALEHSGSITLNGQPFPILPSLVPILAAICDGSKFDPDGWYWIDSICINQADVDERGSQVQLMRRLYATATRTAVWLSPATREMDVAVDFFVELSEWNHGDELAFNDAGKWRAWAALLQRPWWRRMWTIQEFVIPLHLDFHCGGDKIFSREQFHRAMHTHGCQDPDTTIVPHGVRLPAWNRRRMRQRFEANPDDLGLFALMAYTGNSVVSDPRDRVYGILGLAAQDDRLLVGQPAYAEGVETLYWRIVVAFVKLRKRLDIICFSELFGVPYRDPLAGVSERGGEAIASWVPDWRTPTQTFVVPFMVSQGSQTHIGNFRPAYKRLNFRNPVTFSAAGDRDPNVTFSDDRRHMSCLGIIIDSLDGLGECMNERGLPQVEETELIQSTSPTNNALDPPSLLDSSRLLDQIVRSMVLDRQDRDLATRASLAQFRDELVHLNAILGDRADVRSSAIYHYLLTWLRANETIRIRGTTLEDLLRLHNNVKTSQMPPIDLSDAAEETLASRLVDTASLQRMRKRLATTESGHVGMAPLRAKKGDVVCVLFGCSVPVVLRSQGASFEFIGECYLDGYMNGEILDQDRSVQQIVLL
ncbi:heterokaryon incompatibility protein-domain-containing protein [Lasiosphaeris hirsuta]|uniref:Heterokaryon incompatibility protein-domain-containing protein n=1 Tax=Lasiosphaeris hirsuta TaxID=260670 RepID=A0AA40E2X8_9PEZI|nr:heterokaryon incompatibility protein-domain-containing protein [Lasiosphaeris hirsuta]